MGYYRAGFEIVGVDISPQPRYPFTFIQDDALDFLLWVGGFAAVHASPPCQRFSVASKAHNGNAAAWPDLIGPTRAMLKATGLPYVIENVPGAPLCDPIKLCGTMFTELRVIRHRLFECSFEIEPPRDCQRPHPHCFTLDKRKPHYGKLSDMEAYVQVTGGGNCSVRAARDAMGIDWMLKRELNEAVPPAYTEYIGKRLMEVINEQHLPEAPSEGQAASEGLAQELQAATG